MFKKLLGLTLALLLLVAPTAFSAVGVMDEGVYEGEAVRINFKGSTGSMSGGTYTVDDSAPLDGMNRTQSSDSDSDDAYRATDDASNVIYGWSWVGEYRQVNFGLFGWDNVDYTDGASPSGLAADGHVSPTYVNVAGGADYINFTASPNRRHDWTTTGTESTPIERTFRVPDSMYPTASPTGTTYDPDPTFIIMCQNASPSGFDGAFSAGAGTTNYIDWDIVINRSGSAVSTTRYDQDAVALTADNNMQAVTLTYATGRDIQPGDIVTLRVWRTRSAGAVSIDDTLGLDSTLDLRIFGAGFRYIAQW